MKRSIVFSLFFLIFTIASSNLFAQNNNCSYILDGEPVVITGTVESVPAGTGLEVNTGTEVVTVLGLGPNWYWQSLEISKPTIGDQVVINAYTVTLDDDSEVTIMMSIEVNGVSVQLRDPETGCPLWK